MAYERIHAHDSCSQRAECTKFSYGVAGRAANPTLRLCFTSFFQDDAIFLTAVSFACITARHYFSFV